MKIFNAQQIKTLDHATIVHEPISAVDLMERAAQAFVAEFNKRFPNPQNISIFCGLGNNGGDGLAIARLLSPIHNITCYVLGDLQKLSPDAAHNYEKLKALLPITNLIDESQTFELQNITIDAIFGTGLNRTLSGIQAQVIQQINLQKSYVVSVDIPSGMYTDMVASSENVVVQADLTVTFQSPKLSFLLPEHAPYLKSFTTVDIKLDPESIANCDTPYIYVEGSDVANIYKPRDRFTHKGSFGHALVVAGSYGMMGAAVLASQACIRAGAGKTSIYTAQCGYEILQSVVPEAMVETDPNQRYVATPIALAHPYTCIGIGPGLGTHPDTLKAVEVLLSTFQQPMVIDADALNIIATHPHLLDIVPKGSVLTPHPKEFDRLFGNSQNHMERIGKAREKAITLGITIVLKGTYTATCTPEGRVFFNSTGNAGLAKGGSGDVLTGIITALISQKYTPENAAILGVYLHGLCADLIVQQGIQSMESLKAGDLCEHLHLAFERVISL